jgi:hypothetical protein
MLQHSFVFSLALLLVAGPNNTPLAAQALAYQHMAPSTINPAPPEAISYRFAERDWNALIAMLHSSTPPTVSQIDSYVLEMIGFESGEDMFGVSVCSAGFYKIAGSDSDVLVASVDYNGRHFCNDVYVIHHGPNGMILQDANNQGQGLQDFGVDDVSDIVRDLNKDGQHELVIPTEYSTYEGAHCMSIWYRIYTLQSDILVDRSTAFKAFYQKHLDALSIKVLPKAEMRESDDGGNSATCVQMEIDKTKRFLGTSPNAGEDKAIQWLESADESLRLKGIVVLADIGDAQSIRTLQQFTGDHNPIVASATRRALEELQKRVSTSH